MYTQTKILANHNFRLMMSLRYCKSLVPSFISVCFATHARQRGCRVHARSLVQQRRYHAVDGRKSNNMSAGSPRPASPGGRPAAWPAAADAATPIQAGDDSPLLQQQAGGGTPAGAESLRPFPASALDAAAGAPLPAAITTPGTAADTSLDAVSLPSEPRVGTARALAAARIEIDNLKEENDDLKKKNTARAARQEIAADALPDLSFEDATDLAELVIEPLRAKIEEQRATIEEHEATISELQDEVGAKVAESEAQQQTILNMSGTKKAPSGCCARIQTAVSVSPGYSVFRSYCIPMATCF